MNCRNASFSIAARGSASCCLRSSTPNASHLPRAVGVAFAVGNALAQLLMAQAYPLWSLALFGLNVAVIYGLVVHGGRGFRTV